MHDLDQITNDERFFFLFNAILRLQLATFHYSQSLKVLYFANETHFLCFEVFPKELLISCNFEFLCKNSRIKHKFTTLSHIFVSSYKNCLVFSKFISNTKFNVNKGLNNSNKVHNNKVQVKNI